MAQPKIVILDVETTGLDPAKNVIVELGIQLYSASLVLIDEKSWILSDDLVYGHCQALVDPSVGDKFVLNMHNESGLLNEIHERNSTGYKTSHAVAEREAIEWLKKYDLAHNHVQLPLCGSSVHFDRKFLSAQMSELDKVFHYRNIDISSVKELCKIYRPEVTKLAEDNLSPKRAHRVLSDCKDSRDELEFYLEELFLEAQ